MKKDFKITWGSLRGSNNEGFLALLIVVIVVAMALTNPAFVSVDTWFSLIRGALVPTVFALGVLLVIISGGIDVSFLAIGIFAAYSVVRVVTNLKHDPGVLVITLAVAVIGALLGSLNGALVAGFRLNTLIVTLGTQGIIRGVLLAYIGSRYIADLPPSIAQVSTASLITVEGGRAAALHLLVVPTLLLVVSVAAMLRYTMFGRGVYAIGSDVEAARRAGLPVFRYQLMIYVLAGVLAALAGLGHVILSRSANPQTLVGGELDVLAAVVLGGASIFGGRGSVLGTVLGVLLVQIINNSLLLLGVPTAWQRTAVGVALAVGVGIQAVAARRVASRVFVNEGVA